MNLGEKHLEDARNNALEATRWRILNHGTWGAPHCIGFSASSLVIIRQILCQNYNIKQTLIENQVLKPDESLEV